MNPAFGQPNRSRPHLTSMKNTTSVTALRRGHIHISIVAIVSLAAVLVTAFVLEGRAGNYQAGARPAAATMAGSPAPASPDASTATAAATAVATFQCTASILPGSPGRPAAVSAIRTGAHAAFDRVTVQFTLTRPYGVDLRPQTDTTFISLPSGKPVTLAGRVGLLVIVRGGDGHVAYAGPRDIKTAYRALAEVRVVEDFEGQVRLGLGMSGSGCYRASMLSNPTRLVIDIQS